MGTVPTCPRNVLGDGMRSEESTTQATAITCGDDRLPQQSAGRPDVDMPENREQVTPAANILVVDDDPAKRLALTGILSNLGHNLYTAGSGQEALRAITQRDYAVVLLD